MARSSQEIRDLFNLHYDNIISNASPGLNDYEISLYLTQAHREVIYGYYNGNLKGESFDSSEKIKGIFAPYIKSQKLTNISPYPDPMTTDLTYSIVQVSDKIWWILKEGVTLANNHVVIVKPIEEDNFWVSVENPLKKPNNQRAWRLGNAGSNAMRESLIISNQPILSYNITYIERQEPFILSDLSQIEDYYGLSSALSIEGSSSTNIPKPLENNPWLMDVVIGRAVELATRDYKENNLKSQIETNLRDE